MSGPSGRLWLVVSAVLCSILLSASASRAQAPREGRLLVTVVDTTGAVIPGATVNVVGLDDTTKKLTLAPVKTSDKGIATIEHLPLGRYSVQGEFPGFQMGLLRDLRLKAGDNKHVMVLPLEKFSQEVTVGRDTLTSASDRGSTFGTALTREQVEALSDDPDEMSRQLSDMAGPGATIRVDSFEGQQLPPKAQIKAVHITRDMFAAENHYAGGMFIDIITQPGVGPVRGTTRFGFYDSGLDGQNALIPRKGPAQSRNVNANIGGSLIKEKSSFSLSIGGNSNYRTPNLYAATATGVRAESLNLRQPTSGLTVNGLFDYALTKDQTARVSFYRFTNSSENQGVGAYDLPERAYSTDSRTIGVRVQEAGPIGRRFFINTRFALSMADSTSRSAVESPTYVVLDAFTAGGAQRAGGTHTKTVTLQSDLDYVRGIQSWRFGIQFDGWGYRSDASSNYLGTYTFESLDAWQAGLPRSFTQRVGDPTIAYWNYQAAVYAQNDVRVRKSLTLTPGVRFELQNRMAASSDIAPRFGVTWAPFKSGKTTVRGSAGIFYDWFDSSTYAQTVRLNPFHQPEQNTDPTGVVGPNLYLMGANLHLPRNTRFSGGIDQKITKTISFGATYSYNRTSRLLVGRNLNAPVDGVRPDPAFANIIETVDAGRARTHDLSVYGNVSLAPSLPGGTSAGPRFSWRRGLGIYASYAYSRARNNSDGAFAVPATGDLSADWGPASGDSPHYVYMSLNSQAVKNLSASFGLSAYSGSPYTIRTGYDNNGDLIFNDRPAGVGRNTERAATRYNANAYLSYTIGIGKRKVPGGIMFTGSSLSTIGVGQAPDAPRYRIAFTVSAYNVTNHANYGAYSGVMTSPFFLKPTSVSGVRTINFGVSFTF